MGTPSYTFTCYVCACICMHTSVRVRQLCTCSACHLYRFENWTPPPDRPPITSSAEHHALEEEYQHKHSVYFTVSETTFWNLHLARMLKCLGTHQRCGQQQCCSTYLALKLDWLNQAAFWSWIRLNMCGQRAGKGCLPACTSKWLPEYV